jgi:hypothetical protein
MMTKPERPRRCYELTINIGGDTWQDVLNQLGWVEQHIVEHGPKCKSISGTHMSYHQVDIEHNPRMTHQQFMIELHEFLEVTGKEKHGE